MSIQKLSYLNPQVCKVEILPTVNADSLFLPPDGNSVGVTIKYGKAWLPIYVTPGKTTYEEDQQEDQGNPFINQKLEFQYPGEDENSIAYLKNFENSRSIVKFTYSSGLSKIIGDLSNPCTLKIQYSTEKGVRVVTFSRKSESPALNYIE